MRAAVALGSNVGDRLAHLRAGAAAIRARLHVEPAPFLRSRVYRSKPVDCAAGTPEFFNGVIELETALAPLEVLAVLQEIEIESGRPADHGFHTPRTLDLDLLYCDTVQIREPQLTLPHPRLHQRAFVLVPLAEIAPRRPIPGHAKTAAEMLADLGRSSDLEVASTDWLGELKGKP